MSIEQEIHKRGGVVRTALLHGLGLSRHEVRKAVLGGRLLRPRRGWVALPSADPQLVFAARHGVVLSCITQAKRLGLWVLEHDIPHVAVRSTSLTARPAGPCSMHWREPLVLRPPDALTDSIENVLDIVAACQAHDTALAIWDSALQKGLTDFDALSTLPWRGNARVLLEECSPFADSGLETFFRTRLRWLRIPIRAQSWIHGHRVDFLIGDRLVIQIDGRDHTGAQRVKDNSHDALLKLRGYHVIRVSYEQVVYDWPAVQDDILGAIARGLHLAK